MCGNCAYTCAGASKVGTVVHEFRLLAARFGESQLRSMSELAIGPLFAMSLGRRHDANDHRPAA